MKFEILHRTHFSYSSPVRESFNEVRLQPLSNEQQTVESFLLKILPTARLRHYHDFYSNCVHHFDLGRFLAAAARVLQPGGQLFLYTRTPQQNARTIWGRYFPSFTEHEQRLHSQAALRDAVRRTDGLTMVAAQTFQHPRTSTAERLGAQAQGRHYSTFSLYTPQELRASIATFLARLPTPEVCWVDEHLLVVAGGKPPPPGPA